MDQYLHKRYLYSFNTVFDIVDLVIRLSIVILGGLQAVFLIRSGSNYINLFAIAAFILAFHVIIYTQKPHLFHPPHVKSIVIPLAEKIRCNWFYKIIAALFFSNLVLTYLNLVPVFEAISRYSDIVYYFISFSFLLVFILYMLGLSSVVNQLKNNKYKKVQIGMKEITNISSFIKYISGEVLIISILFILFIYMYLSSPIDTALYDFGNLLIGSFGVFIIRDLLLGKWTHSIG